MSANKFILRFSEGKLPEHIERPAYESLKNDSRHIYKFLLSKYATDNDVDDYITNTLDSLYKHSSFIRRNDIQNKISSSTVDKLMRLGYHDLVGNNNNMSQETFNLHWSSGNKHTQQSLLYNKHNSIHNIRKFLGNDPRNLQATHALVTHTDANKNDLLYGINHNNEEIQKHAKQHPKYKEYFPNGHENI